MRITVKRTCQDVQAPMCTILKRYSKQYIMSFNNLLNCPAEYFLWNLFTVFMSYLKCKSTHKCLTQQNVMTWLHKGIVREILTLDILNFLSHCLYVSKLWLFITVDYTVLRSKSTENIVTPPSKITEMGQPTFTGGWGGIRQLDGRRNCPTHFLLGLVYMIAKVFLVIH